jgi:hypothetical protein
LFSNGCFWQLQKWPKSLVYFFQHQKLCINFDKNRLCSDNAKHPNSI